MVNFKKLRSKNNHSGNRTLEKWILGLGACFGDLERVSTKFVESVKYG